MKVWQPGGHLSEERGGEVRDWSWGRTRRRLGILVRLTLPYKRRTLLALATLLSYTLVALAPPFSSERCPPGCQTFMPSPSGAPG